jgi:hypothetical protein
MKAIDRPFTKIINGTTQFVIPVFQRDYSWSEPNCEQLWRDVLHISYDPTDRGHFLGSFVYISTGDTSAGFTRWLLIDGQQRLTTLTLLLAALRDHIAEGWSGPEDGPTAKRIDAYFLKNLQEDGDRQQKLVLRGSAGRPANRELYLPPGDSGRANTRVLAEVCELSLSACAGSAFGIVESRTCPNARELRVSV